MEIKSTNVNISFSFFDNVGKMYDLYIIKFPVFNVILCCKFWVKYTVFLW